jgi:hypothetical protein
MIDESMTYTSDAVSCLKLYVRPCLTGTVVQCALRSHLFLVQCFDQPGFVEQELPRR